MRLWFMGGGPFAALCLDFMRRDLTFEKIITGHPTVAGRGLKERVLPVEEMCMRTGLVVERTGAPEKNAALTDALVGNPPDIIFVVDFSRLIKEPFLSAPRFGCLNIHPSLLPRWRGAAPIQRALMNGDTETGVTIFRLTRELDAGPVLCRKEIPVSVTDTAALLFRTLAMVGSQIAFEGVQSISEGSYQFSDQDSEFATYANKMTKAEAQISWTWSSERIHNTVRAFDMSSGAFAANGGKRLKLWRTLPVDPVRCEEEAEAGRILCFAEGDPVISCGEGALRLLTVQSEGKGRVSGAEWARGARLKTGSVFT